MKPGENNWQNFSLNIELSNAGNFIYDGLKIFDEMEHFAHPDESFSFLYKISVGIERLFKILIILLECNGSSEIEELEKSLITHNHIELNRMVIEKGIQLNLSTIHNAFLGLLTNFYKSQRYDRFSLADNVNDHKEQDALILFIEKYLKIDISLGFLTGTLNNDRIKCFIGKIIGFITTALYKQIYNVSSNKGLFTYEIRVDSKAYKIYLRKEFNFIKERLFKKELLLYLLNQSSDYLDAIKEFNALEFDPALISDHISAFISESKLRENIDEYDSFVDELTARERKEREEFIGLIGEDFSLE